MILVPACTQSAGSYAGRVERANELIGGPGALGEVGDYLISNQKVRFIIQDKGWSRGFGIFGGGVIDADLVRPGTDKTRPRGNGHDNFGEFFPALFMQAFEVAAQQTQDPLSGEEMELPAIEIIADGSDGKAAVIRTRASGGDFITMIRQVLGMALPQSGFRFESDYILEPGARHLRIVCRLVNTSRGDLDFSGDAIADVLGIAGLHMPLGDIALFGGGNKVFAPAAVQARASLRGKRLDEQGQSSPDVESKPVPVGFNLRYGVEESYQTLTELGLQLPALPGLVTELLATSGEEVSYGFAVADNDRNFVWENREQYGRDPHVAKVIEQHGKHAMLVPFQFSSFTGAYYQLPPATLKASDSFEFEKYLIVGDGDVASVRQELFTIRGSATGSIRGEVRRTTGAPEVGVDVHFLTNDGRPYTQAKTDGRGEFVAHFEPGKYRYVVTAGGRYNYPEANRREEPTFAVDVVAGEAQRLAIELPEPGEVIVTVLGDHGQPMPAKVMLLGGYGPTDLCAACTSDCVVECDLRQQPDIFDLSLGEGRRSSDMAWERRGGGLFIEQHLLAGADGVGRGLIRPGTYDLYVSRGMEYDLFIQRAVRIEAGGATSLVAQLHRSVDTTDWVSADLHVHAMGSLDSSMQLTERVRAAAAEGLEIAVATDHNYITDYAPAIAREGLEPWLGSVVGVELSTLEMGHFNAFPLLRHNTVASRFPFVELCNRQNRDKVNGTAFDWVECAPGQLFSGLRALGDPQGITPVVQVNHPRDTILGYFNQYYVNPHTGLPQEPTEDNYATVSDPLRLRPQRPEIGQFAIERFSFAFDALEVYNGKRQDQIHDFIVPEESSAEKIAMVQDPCLGGHPENGAGKPLLRQGGHTAYPGAADDWFRMLNQGKRITATGNSDSHELEAEVGSPRNYLYLPRGSDGQPRDVHPNAVGHDDLVAAIKKHRVLVTNGPFLKMTVHTENAAGGDPITWKIGDSVTYQSSNAGRKVRVDLSLFTADWVVVDTIKLYANGELLDSISVPGGVNAESGRAEDDAYALAPRYYTFDDDTWLVAEATGGVSMFPVVTPPEDPPTDVADALAGVVGGMGLGAAFGGGELPTPTERLRVTPFALTNPIWLYIGADDVFSAPGNADGPEPATASNCPQRSLATRRATPRVVGGKIFDPPGTDGGEHRQRWDLRKVFHAH